MGFISHKIFALLVFLLFGLLAFHLLMYFNASSVQDDAFMFVRYADNILNTGEPSFNSGHEATYGLTSPSFLAMVLPLRVVFPHNPVLTMLFASSISAILFLILLVYLLHVTTGRENTLVKQGIFLVILLSILCDAKNFSVHFSSGMDTMLALSFLTAYILVSIRYRESVTLSSVLFTGILGGLAFSIRPDLLIFCFALPLVTVFFSSTSRKKVHAAAILLVTILVVLLQILFYSKYLNSPLPLPFYAKSINHYGAYFQEMYKLFPVKGLIKFVFSFPLLFSVIGIALFIDVKGFWKWISETTKGLFLATFIFIVYHLFFVTPIMDYSQRFYYPTLPAIMFLSIQSMRFIIERTSLKELIESRMSGTVNSRAILAFLFLFPVFAFGPRIAQSSYELLTSREGNYNGFDVTEEYRARWTGYWFRLDEFSLLPNDLVMAATEIGHPLAMNPYKTVIDMTGLNETRIAHSGFSADSFFYYYQPDLIFMPHPDYQDMIEKINENSHFISHYEVFSVDYLSTTLSLAIREDSEYYQQMKLIVTGDIQINL